MTSIYMYFGFREMDKLHIFGVVLYCCVLQAITSFSKAIHLNPTESELWEEDLKWARFLLSEKLEMSPEKKAHKELVEGVTREKSPARQLGKESTNESSQESSINSM